MGPLDRSSSKPSNPSKSNVIKTFLQESSVIDSWGFFFLIPQAGSTHFSPLSITLTPILIIFPRQQTYTLHLLMFSQFYRHNRPRPSVLRFNRRLNSVPKFNTSWCFNTRLLSHGKFLSFLSAQISVFIAINEIPVVFPSLLLETFKAYIRG